MTTQNTILDAIYALDQAPSILKVKEVVRCNAERHGYSAFLCSAPPSLGRQIINPILFEEWPDAWRRTYISRRHYVHDPMLKEIFRTTEPFLWSETMKQRTCTKAERTVMAEAAEAKMAEGFVVPLYGIGGAVHALTMTGEKPRTDITARAELRLISIYAYARARQLRRRSGGTPVVLTDRQREALRWVALGKTDPEIGLLMGISDSSAHKLVESAKRKWNVATRIQAVVESIRHGDLQF